MSILGYLRSNHISYKYSIQINLHEVCQSYIQLFILSLGMTQLEFSRAMPSCWHEQPDVVLACQHEQPGVPVLT